MDSFLLMHHVGFNVLKISPLRLAPFSVLFKTYFESVYFPKLHTFILQLMICTPVWKFTGFLIVIMADQVSKLLKQRKTADIFYTIFSIKLYIVSHVTLM